MRENRNNVRGFVLPAVIGAIVIIGVLISVGFFLAQQELRMGVANRHANMAFNIAQAGANEVLANWNGYQLGNIAAWDETVINETFGSIGEWEVTIHNANNYVYFRTATGQVTNAGIWSGARRTIGIVTKMIFADIDPPGALTTRGKVKVYGNAQVDGSNEDPADWDAAGLCDAFSDDPLPGIINDGEAITGDPGKNILGTPPTQTDATLADDSFTDFGNLTWDELKALAIAEGKDLGTATPLNSIGPSLTGAECNEADIMNWGDLDSADPCGAYFPLIYSNANPQLRLTGGGQGQGILLVERDLEMSGGFQFNGIIITMGTFSTVGNDNTVQGAVMASNGIALDDTGLGGTSNIQYSRCAVQRAILNNANLSRARPIAERSWVDLTSAVN